MTTTECIICLNDICNNDYFTLTCCKNDVHICCLNNWVSKNITKTNISKCFICSQANSMIETMVLYNKNNSESVIDYEDTNSITNHNNNININNEVVLFNTNHMLTISYDIDKRLYFLFISIKLCFFISVSCLLIFVIYFII